MLDSEEIKTEYFNIAFGPSVSPKGKVEKIELVQRIEQPDSEWIWKRQVQRGVIV